MFSLSFYSYSSMKLIQSWRSSGLNGQSKENTSWHEKESCGWPFCCCFSECRVWSWACYTCPGGCSTQKKVDARGIPLKTSWSLTWVVDSLLLLVLHSCPLALNFFLISESLNLIDLVWVLIISKYGYAYFKVEEFYIVVVWGFIQDFTYFMVSAKFVNVSDPDYCLMAS